MPQTIIRRVLINERDFEKMRYQCLVKSTYGNRKLYDTCEWRPLTTHDLLIDLIKHNEKQSLYQYFHRHIRSTYDQHYPYDYDLLIDKNGILVGRRKHSRYWHQFGWATVTKVKE